MTTEHLIKTVRAIIMEKTVIPASIAITDVQDEAVYDRLAQDIVAVFEEDHTVADGSVHVTARHSTSVTNSEAHTPTNDERARVVSALEDLAIEHNLFDVVVAEEIADAVLAGFRRYDPPTNDEREALTDAALWDFADDLLDAWNIEDRNPPSLTEDFRDRFVSRFRRSEVPEPSAEDYPDAEGLAVLRSNSSEPQGEPSDAQVLAALNAYYADYMIRPNKSLDDVRPPRTVQDMRAALKAAFDQKGES
ncbi:hypothetical protein GCM10009651_35930 [Microbacterium natoriense]|uniref:hypothetical protein n=1 Tax=Microbacterium natoriense TaxID=284570 RepID=UPI0031D7C0E7